MRRVYLCEQCDWESSNPPFDAGYYSCARCGSILVVKQPGREDDNKDCIDK